MKPASYAPLYCAIYPEIAEIARKHGYALAIHGSLARDFDLIAIPWIDEAAAPDTVIEEIVNSFAIKRIEGLVAREHGRMVQTVSVSFGECFLDLSFMPRVASSELRNA
jgi:hypothetical protein